MVYIAVEFSEMVSRINAVSIQKSRSVRLNEQIAAKKKKLAKIRYYKQEIYQDWKDGEISQEDYRYMQENYERQIETVNDAIHYLNMEKAELERGTDAENSFPSVFGEPEDTGKLTRELLIALVEQIKVYENGNIRIKLKFANEYRRIAEHAPKIHTNSEAI